MMDKEGWAFVLFITVMAVIIVPIVWFGTIRLEERTEWCTEKGGVMVKALDGWKCIDAKVMK